MNAIVTSATSALSSLQINTIHLKRVARPRAPMNVATRAMTSWKLDGVGCAASRGGNGARLSGASNQNCPTHAIDVSTLCASHEGRFEMAHAMFEQEGDALYLYSTKASEHSTKDEGGGFVSDELFVDGRPAPASSWSKIKLKPGQIVNIAGVEFQLYRNVHAHA